MTKVLQSIHLAKSADEIFHIIEVAGLDFGFEITILPSRDSGKHLVLDYLLSPRRNGWIGPHSTRIDFADEKHQIAVREGSIVSRAISHREIIFVSSQFDVYTELIPKSIKFLFKRLALIFRINQPAIITPLYYEQEVYGVMVFTDTNLQEDDVPALSEFSRDVSKALKKHQDDMTRVATLNERLLESMYVGIVREDRKGALTYINREASRMLGYEEGELAGRQWTTITPSDQESIVRKANKRRLQGKLDRYELELLRKDGSRLPVLVSAGPYLEEGKFKGTLAVFTDLSMQKSAEEAIKESKQKLQNLFDKALDGIVYLNASGKILELNPAAAELLGGSQQDLIGQQFTDLAFSSKAVRSQLDSFFSEISLGDETTKEFQLTNLRGDEQFLEFTSAVIMNGKKASGFLVVIRDVSQRKLAEERFRVIFDSAPDGYYLTDLKGKFIDGNKEAERITGFRREELIGKSFIKLNLLPKDQIGKAASRLAKNAQGKPTRHDEFSLIRKDGSRVEVEIATEPVSIEGKTYVLGIARDITERKRTERLLREQEELTRAIVETSQDWIWAIDREGIHTYSNPAIERILGYNPSELIGKSSLELMLEEDRAEIDNDLPGWVSREEGWEGRVIRWRHKDGSIQHLESSAVPIFDANDEVVGFRGVDRDITERVHTERELQAYSEQLEWMVGERTKELKESEERFQTLLSSINDVVWATSADGSEVLYVNGAVEHVYGCAIKDFFEKPEIWIEMVHPDDRERVQRESRDLLTSGAIESEYRIIRPDSSVRWLHDRKSVIFDEQGAPVRLGGIARDITWRKNTEEELKQHRDHLEELVEQRTSELKRINKTLGREIVERVRAREELELWMEQRGRIEGLSDADLEQVLELKREVNALSAELGREPPYEV